MRVGSLFSGYGGLDMAVEDVLGGELAWVSDIDKGACKILAYRYPDVSNLGDISKVDWSTVEPVDVITGGFPCQDVSHAGKRAGLNSETRTGLWSQMATAIDVLRPSLVVAENVRGLLSAEAASDVEPCPWCLGDGAGESPMRALGAVLADLADIGYDAQWCGLRAADVGAPHGRFRVFVVAYPASDKGRLSDRDGDAAGDADYEHPATVRALPRWPFAEHRGSLPFTDPDGLGGQWGGRARGGRPGLADDGVPSADAESDGWDEGWTEPAWLVGGSDAAERGAVDWGIYEAAIRRWERILGRPAPAPTMTSTKGSRQLAPPFVEWMQGLPAGWVTDVPGLSRAEQLKAFGNGVVWQQAAAALRYLLAPLSGRVSA